MSLGPAYLPLLVLYLLEARILCGLAVGTCGLLKAACISSLRLHALGKAENRSGCPAAQLKAAALAA
jgi:hypothetical protein